MLSSRVDFFFIPHEIARKFLPPPTTTTTSSYDKRTETPFSDRERAKKVNPRSPVSPLPHRLPFLFSSSQGRVKSIFSVRTCPNPGNYRSSSTSIADSSSFKSGVFETEWTTTTTATATTSEPFVVTILSFQIALGARSSPPSCSRRPADGCRLPVARILLEPQFLLETVVTLVTAQSPV